MRWSAATRLSALLVAGLALGFGATGSGVRVAWSHDASGHRTGEPATRESTDSGEPAWLPLQVGGPFSLVDHTGRPRTERDFHGRHTLLFFGYASCDGICPVALRRVAATLDRLGNAADRVQPLFITIDPKRDTPARLAATLAKIHPRLLGLTGTPPEVAAALAAYGVAARPVGRSGDDGVVLSHTSFVYLMGPEGRLLSLLPPVMDVEPMARTLRRHLH